MDDGKPVDDAAVEQPPSWLPSFTRKEEKSVCISCCRTSSRSQNALGSSKLAPVIPSWASEREATTAPALVTTPRTVCSAIHQRIFSAQIPGKGSPHRPGAASNAVATCSLSLRAAARWTISLLAPLLPPSWSARHPRIRQGRRCCPSRHQLPRSSSTRRLLEKKKRSGPRLQVHLLLRFMKTRASFRPVWPRPQQTPLTPLLLLRHAAPLRLAPPRAQCRRQHSPRPLVRARQIRGGVDRLWLTREEWDARSTSTA